MFKALLSAGLLCLLGLLFIFVWRVFSLGNVLDGMRQPAGLVERGTLPFPIPLERWRESDSEELAFWACDSAEFAHGYARGSLRFENAAAARHTIIMELRAVLKEGQEPRLVYRSPPIPPGHMLNGDKLDIALPAGTYDAFCVAVACGPDGKTPMAQSDQQEIKLTINN
ncbi:MAG: hypothetical protein FWH26_10590 [Oscillospiraceae bacterium]|nr:hypothetical protein [Oscillospiraceae bacterium]